MYPSENVYQNTFNPASITTIEYGWDYKIGLD